MGEVARSSLEGIHYPPLTVLEVIKVSLQYHDRTDTGFRCCAGRPRDDLLRLGFKQFSFHQTMRVLQGIVFSIFSAILALRACSCPLWVSPLGRLVGLEGISPNLQHLFDAINSVTSRRTGQVHQYRVDPPP